MTAERPSRNERAILALLSTRTQKDAARLIGCSPRTLQRMQKDEVFRGEYAAAKAQLLEQVTGRLRAESGAAVDVLAAVAGDSEAPSAARVSAARSVIELALKSHEVECLEERIERLERGRDEN